MKLKLLRLFRHYINDKKYLELIYYIRMKDKLDLEHPKTFTEKIQWLKLYNRKDEYTLMVDKYSVKEYVSRIIGDKYIIPTLGVWNTVNDINWDCLPDKFVMKTTHGGGGCAVVICNDKSSFDKEFAIKKMQRSLNNDIYDDFVEWPYKNVHKRIIAEQFIGDNLSCNSDLVDYKFFCFNGEPRFCQVIQDRRKHETIDFFDMNWEHQEFIGLNPDVEHSYEPIDKPINLDEMINIARKLSIGIPFLRVDLYNVLGQIYFGELTFFPASGMGAFYPSKWNRILGDMIVLSVE